MSTSRTVISLSLPDFLFLSFTVNVINALLFICSDVVVITAHANY